MTINNCMIEVQDLDVRLLSRDFTSFGQEFLVLKFFTASVHNVF